MRVEAKLARLLDMAVRDDASVDLIEAYASSVLDEASAAGGVLPRIPREAALDLRLFADALLCDAPDVGAKVEQVLDLAYPLD